MEYLAMAFGPWLAALILFIVLQLVWALIQLRK